MHFDKLNMVKRIDASKTEDEVKRIYIFCIFLDLFLFLIKILFKKKVYSEVQKKLEELK